jgi:hypothetical protein
MENDELDIQHRVLIVEEEIEISELPKEIINAIRNFNIKLDRYEETGNTDLFFQLQQDDVAIADDIQTFIEDSEADDEDDEEEDDTYAQEEEEVNKNNQNNQLSSLEQMVIQSLKNNLISVEQLQKILKREPDYPNEQVGKIRLRKLYLKPFYEVF